MSQLSKSLQSQQAFVSSFLREMIEPIKRRYRAIGISKKDHLRLWHGCMFAFLRILSMLVDRNHGGTSPPSNMQQTQADLEQPIGHNRCDDGGVGETLHRDEQRESNIATAGAQCRSHDESRVLGL